MLLTMMLYQSSTAADGQTGRYLVSPVLGKVCGALMFWFHYIVVGGVLYSHGILLSCRLLQRFMLNPLSSSPLPAHRTVVIAASAGGLTALSHILEVLPSDFPAAIAVVQHISRNHRSLAAEILNRRTKKEGQTG